MQARITELEIYEEREMIGDPAGLGGPSISESIRDRNNARDTESRLKEAEFRIRILERDIRLQEWAHSMSRYIF